MSITTNPAAGGRGETPGLAFLMAQVGARAAGRFAERLGPLGLRPSHAGILRILGEAGGLGQRTLAERLGMFPSRLVLVLDEMEKMGLVERREGGRDRRTRQIGMTPAGRSALRAVGRAARLHAEEMGSGLSGDERSALAALLQRVAARQGLTQGVHPGYRSLGPGD